MMDMDSAILIIRTPIFLVEKPVKGYCSFHFNTRSVFRQGPGGTVVAEAVGAFEGGSAWVSVQGRQLYHFFAGAQSPLKHFQDGGELTATQMDNLFVRCGITVFRTGGLACWPICRSPRWVRRLLARSSP